MRDRHDNVVIVCSIENIDPMGVHTGDSVTVAPAMTLTDREYQHMRDVAIAIARAVGVDTGGCNIQFAVHPEHRPDGRDRDEPAGLPVQRPGLQGHRLPDRQDRRPAGHRLHPGRDPQRHHRRDPGQLRARPRLRRGQGAAVRVREVPRRRPRADHPHEVGRRGHGHRPQLPRGAAEGAALAGETPARRSAGPGRRATPASCWPAARSRTTAGWPPSTRPCGPGATVAEVAGATGIDPWFIDQIAGIEEIARELAASPPPGPGAAAPGQAAGFSDAQIGQLHRPDRGRRPRSCATQLGIAAGLQHRGHLRRRVRGPHAVPVLHLRRGDRGPGRRPAEGDHPGQRPEPDRPGHRVRLRLRARLVRARRRPATRP